MVMSMALAMMGYYTYIRTYVRTYIHTHYYCTTHYCTTRTPTTPKKSLQNCSQKPLKQKHALASLFLTQISFLRHPSAPPLLLHPAHPTQQRGPQGGGGGTTPPLVLGSSTGVPPGDTDRQLVIWACGPRWCWLFKGPWTPANQKVPQC